MSSTGKHHDQDAHTGTNSPNLNKLRAAVLGANDGIVSVASIIFGVAGATDSRGAIFTAGLAGLVAGALSMAVGEYVSVSTQRDTERAYIEHENWELQTRPEQEMEELAGMYEAKGLTTKTARQVARELTAHDPLRSHLDAELNIDPDELTSPVQAGLASMVSFTAGAAIPLLSVMLAQKSSRIAVTFAAVVAALMLTGYLSATAGGASRRRAIGRVVAGGIAAMLVTYLIGHLFGAAVS